MAEGYRSPFADSGATPSCGAPACRRRAWIGGPGPRTMPVLNRQSAQQAQGRAATPRRSCFPLRASSNESQSFILRRKTGRPATRIRPWPHHRLQPGPTPTRPLRFRPDLFLCRQATRGDLSELEYKSAPGHGSASARTRLDAYMTQAQASMPVVFSAGRGASIAAKAGYPKRPRCLPWFFIGGVEGKAERRTFRCAAPSLAAPLEREGQAAAPGPTPTSRPPRRVVRPPGLPALLRPDCL